MAKPNPIEVQKALKGIHYPADRSDLAAQAKKNRADRGLVQRIEKLQDDTYERPSDVQKALFD